MFPFKNIKANAKNVVVRTVALTRRARLEVKRGEPAEVTKKPALRMRPSKVVDAQAQGQDQGPIKIEAGSILATPIPGPPPALLGYQTPSPPLFGKRKQGPTPPPTPPSPPLLGKRKRGPTIDTPSKRPSTPTPPPDFRFPSPPISSAPPSDPFGFDEPGPSKCKGKGKGKERDEDDEDKGKGDPESEVSSVGQIEFVRKGCPRCLEREQQERRARTRRNSF